MNAYRCIAAGVLVSLVAVAQAETLEDVAKKIAKCNEKVETLQYDMKHTMEMDTGQMQMKSESAGTVCTKRAGEHWLLRTEGENKVAMNAGGDATTRQTKNTSVCDGEYYYTCAEGDGQTMAMKMDIPAEAQMGEKMFEALRKDNNLKLLPDDSVAGRKTWVVEATPKQPQPHSPARNVYYFDQEIGIALQVLGYDGEDKVMSRMTISNLKINPEIESSQFEFKAPAGVTIMDMTQHGRGQPQQSQDQAQAEEPQKAEQPAEEQQEEETEEKKGVGGIKLPF